MRKIIGFDLETTGLDKNKDYIIQISAVKFDRDTGEILETYDSYVRPIGNYSISMAAYFKHHIKPDFLADKPYFKDIAQDVVNFFEDTSVDILTYNGNSFDIPFLMTELNRCGLYIDFINRNCYDSFLEEKRRNGNTLGETFERYVGLSMEEAGLQAHNSLSDVKATYLIFEHQNEISKVNAEKMYGEDGIIKEMVFQDKLCPCFSIGKYRQVSVKFVSEIDQGYLKWCVSDKSNFMRGTKEYLKQFIK